MSMSLPVRFLYWSIIVASSIVLVSAVKCLLYAVRPNIGFWQHALLTSGIFALIYTPLVQIGTRIFFDASEIYILRIPDLFVMVFAISVSIHAIKYSLTSGNRQNEPRLMRRLPDEIKAPILRLTVRDHHVDVFTEKGEVELRLRFADAVDEMEGVDGLCVHRSHLGNSRSRNRERKSERADFSDTEGWGEDSGQQKIPGQCGTSRPDINTRQSRPIAFRSLFVLQATPFPFVRKQESGKGVQYGADRL